MYLPLGVVGWPCVEPNERKLMEYRPRRLGNIPWILLIWRFEKVLVIENMKSAREREKEPGTEQESNLPVMAVYFVLRK